MATALSGARKVAKFIKRVKRRLRRQRETLKRNQVNEDTMTQPLPGAARAVSAENELDIRWVVSYFLWAGKFWIIGIGLLFAHIALAYTFCSSGVECDGDHQILIANMLGGYCSAAVSAQHGY